jgi:hypothetical protein
MISLTLRINKTELNENKESVLWKMWEEFEFKQKETKEFIDLVVGKIEKWTGYVPSNPSYKIKLKNRKKWV